MSVLRASGDGKFAVEANLGYMSSSMNLGDLNGDGILDMVFADSIKSIVVVRRGLGEGTFANFVGPSQFAVGTVPLSATLAGVNGDGRIDVLTGSLVKTQSPDPPLKFAPTFVAAEMG